MIDLTSELADIDNELDLITPRSTYDGYYISIYKLLIKEITEGNLDPSDYDDLNEIAQDYTDSSYPNVTAYSTFNLCSSDPYPDYSFKCEEEPRAEEIQSNIINSNTIEINVNQINPNLETLMSSDPNRVLTLYDLTGRCVYTNYVAALSTPFDLTFDLVPGVYYYRITSDNFDILFSSGLFPIIK